MHVSEYPNEILLTQRICEWLIKFSNHLPDGAIARGSSDCWSPQLAKWITLLTGWLIRARNDTRQPKGLPLSGGLCLRDQHWGLRQVGSHPTSADPGMMGSRWTETNQDRRQSNGSFDPTDDSGPPCRSYVGESRVAAICKDCCELRRISALSAYDCGVVDHNGFHG